MAKCLVLVGFTPVDQPRVDGAKLPEEVALFAIDEIGIIPAEYLRAEYAYYNSCFGDPTRSRLLRLFGARAIPVDGVAKLEAKMSLEFPEISKAVGDFLTPKPFRITDPIAERQIGRAMPNIGIPTFHRH